LGAQYTLEKGIFQQKPKLPNGYWSIEKTESVSRKISNGVTYYNFTVKLNCESSPYLIRANYVVSFNSSNGNTAVTSTSYAALRNPGGPVIADAPSFIDNRLLTKGSKLQAFLDEGIKYTVKDALAKGLIKKSTYTFAKLFRIQDTGYSFPYGYNFLIQLVSKQGYNYRAQIVVYDNTGLDPSQKVDPQYTIYPNA